MKIVEGGQQITHSVGLFILSHDTGGKKFNLKRRMHKDGENLFAYVLPKAGHSPKTGAMRKGAYFAEAPVHGVLNTWDVWLYKRWPALSLLRFIWSEIGARMAWYFFWHCHWVYTLHSTKDVSEDTMRVWGRDYCGCYIPPEDLYGQQLIERVRSTSYGLCRVGMNHRGELVNFEDKTPLTIIDTPGRRITRRRQDVLVHKDTRIALTKAFKLIRAEYA